MAGSDPKVGDPTHPPRPGPKSEAEAESSPASLPASGTSEDAPGFIADPGPEFDPEAAPPQPAPEPEPAPLIEWEEDTVRALLMLKGRAVHAGIGVAEHDWTYTEVDLAAIAPPLTRIANRYEPVARLARHADPLLLFFAFGGYGVRSLEERAAVLRELAAEDTAVIEPLPADEAEGLARQQPQQRPPTPAPGQQWATVAQGPPPPPAVAPPQQQAPAAPAARPGEADVDPSAINWEVPRQ